MEVNNNSQINNKSYCDIFKIAQNGIESLLNLALDNLKIYNFNINDKNKSGDTLLHIVVQQGKIDTTKKILQLGANINQKNNNGETPIFNACSEGHLKILHLLYKKGALDNIPNNKNQTCLYKAIRKKQIQVVQYLIQANKKFMKEYRKFQTEACQNGIVENLKFCIKVDDKIRCLGDLSALQVSVMFQQTNLVKILLDSTDFDTCDHKKRTLLHLAVMNKNIHILKLLLAKISPQILNAQDANGLTILHYAIELNSVDILTLILKHKPNLRLRDIDSYEAIHTAAQKSTDCLKILLKQPKIKVETFTNSGDLSLHLAAAFGNLENVFLLYKDAHRNCLNSDGLNAYNLALNNGHVKICEFLSTRKTNCDILNNFNKFNVVSRGKFCKQAAA